MIEFEPDTRFDKQKWEKNRSRPNRKAQRQTLRDIGYLKRPIVAIDGEGINVRSGPRKGDHLYIMLAISDKQPLIWKLGLQTKDILDYLWNNLRPSDLNVIYGGSYDFNLWVRDLPADKVERLYKGGYRSAPVMFGDYGLRWLKGKGFEIVKDNKTLIINDVISFFQCPFIEACDSYLGSYEGREELVREKARRGNFTAAEVDAVSHYNQLELRLLVQLVTELRTRLFRVGLKPRRFNSPGAIASALLDREGVKKHRNESLPDAVMEAARYAYAGGRFEPIKYGIANTPAWEYDKNSAYPAAMRELPSLVGGEWVHHIAPTAAQAEAFENFTMYRIKYVGGQDTINIPGPMFVRAQNGTVSYPTRAFGWIWSPEYYSLKQYCKQYPSSTYTIVEAWEYKEAPARIRPFAFMDPLYAQRQKLKALKDGAHVGIKLGMNSCYGKIVQQVGWKPATARFPMRVPTYHQLEWGGYITSSCRAAILLAALQNMDAVIAFETDALFTSAPLNLDTSDGLGNWEEKKFSSLTYIQSGHYYGTTEDGEIIKSRGVDRGHITRARVERRMRKPAHERFLDAPLTRFYGAGIALHRGLEKYWCKWLTETKSLTLAPTGKRVHGACDCADPHGPLTPGWHKTFCPINGHVSHEYPVDWINPNPDMTELAELRESENTWED